MVGYVFINAYNRCYFLYIGVYFLVAKSWQDIFDMTPKNKSEIIYYLVDVFQKNKSNGETRVLPGFLWVTSKRHATYLVSLDTTILALRDL